MVIAGGFGGFDEASFDGGGGGFRGAGVGGEVETGIGGEVFAEDAGGDRHGLALHVGRLAGPEAHEFSAGGQIGPDRPVEDLAPEALVDVFAVDLAHAPGLVGGEIEGASEPDGDGGEEGVFVDIRDAGVVGGIGGILCVGVGVIGDGPDDGGGLAGLGEGAVPIPEGDVGPECSVGVGVEAELAEDGGVAFGCETGAEAEFGVVVDLFGGPLRGEGDGEDVGEGGVGELFGHVALAGDSDEGGAFIADGGGDELLLIVGEGVGGDVAEDDDVEGGPFFAGFGEELGFELGIVGGGFDGGWR